MIKVADAIMGSGKSSAAINFMNSHNDTRFIYVTPYISEARRIAKACPDLNFVEPKPMSEYNGSKIKHTAELISQGLNIATTHQAIRLYDPNVLQEIKDKGYIMILDEAIDTLSETGVSTADIRMLEDSGYIIRQSDNSYKINREKEYKGELCRRFFSIVGNRDIVCIGNKRNTNCFYWQFSPEVFTAFKDVYILTYMFKAQNLCYFLQMNHLPIKYIGIEKTKDGYRFDDNNIHFPEYVYTIRDKLHVITQPKLNISGLRRTALSENWFAGDAMLVPRLRMDIYNFFRNYAPDNPEVKLWSTFTTAKNKIKGKGYTKRYTPFNLRATNEYSSATHLAYCVNLYMNVGQKLYFRHNGIEVDDDAYALSTMIQWIWRSAIRNGEEVWVYVPSARMRGLLQDWLDGLEALNPDKDEYERRKALFERAEEKLTDGYLMDLNTINAELYRWKRLDDEEKEQEREFLEERRRTRSRKKKEAAKRVKVPNEKYKDINNKIGGM